MDKSIYHYSLDKWGIFADQLPKLVDESFTKGRMDNNIVDLNKKDVMSILKDIF